MTIAHCPRCSEQVSVPESASREATVQCPFCQDEYSLAEALAQLPPALIVVSDFGATAAHAVADDEDAPWSAVNLADDDVDEIALAPMDDASPEAAFDFTSGSAAAGGKAKTAIRPSSRPRKPKGSPIKSVLSMAIGGLLAFPIAQMILWHLPGEWKRDFGAGPIVAQYVPQIVPKKFHGNKLNAEADSNSGTQDSGSDIPDFQFGGAGEFSSAGTGPSSQSEDPFRGSSGGGGDAGNDPANKKKKKQKSDGAVTASEEPMDDEPMSLEDSAAAGADVFGTPLEVPELDLGALPLIDAPAAPIFPTELPDTITKVNKEPASEVPPPDDVPATSEAPQPEVAPLAPGNIRNAPRVSSDDVAQRVQAALSGDLAWDTNEAAAPTKAIKLDFYFALSKLGEALTFADRSDETVAAQITETATLLQKVSQQTDKLAVIGGVANGWIGAGHENRKTDGICLFGVVKAVEPIGDLFETTVESSGQQIVVVSTSDPAEYFEADRQVLILGTILDDPAKNLGGYEGTRKVVVLDGYHVNVPAE